jgi:hypothetical protein
MKSGLNDKTFVKILPKFIKNLLPEGVIDIEYDIEKLSDDEYYMGVTLIVPDDSPLLLRKNEFLMMKERNELREELKRNILGFFGKRMIINSTGIRAESFHNQSKINFYK